MRAGLLKDIVVFKAPRKVRSRTGGVNIVYDDVLRCRGHKRKFSNVTDKDRVDAYEEFNGHFGIIQVRYHPKIKEDQIVEFRGTLYKIILLDLRDDHTYWINVNRLNP